MGSATGSTNKNNGDLLTDWTQKGSCGRVDEVMHAALGSLLGSTPLLFMKSNRPMGFDSSKPLRRPAAALIRRSNLNLINVDLDETVGVGAMRVRVSVR